jgi:cytochrome c biogenesis factor
MTLGKVFLLTGLVIALIGLVLIYVPGLLGWFGHLPGDIRIERGNGRFFLPVTSMIVISVILTIIINLFFRR